MGRLDKDSEGLLLFTNDGTLAQQLLHPRHQVDKVYQVTVSGALEGAEERLSRMRMLEGEPIQPAGGDHPSGQEPADPPDVPSGGAFRAAATAGAGAYPAFGEPSIWQVEILNR